MTASSAQLQKKTSKQASGRRTGLCLRDDHHHPQQEEEGGGVIGQENLVRTSVNFRESPVDCVHRQDGWGWDGVQEGGDEGFQPV